DLCHYGYHESWPKSHTAFIWIFDNPFGFRMGLL
ncbi:uncharacterized protein METZ01_LOCUS82345, partial [marine metagenome]